MENNIHVCCFHFLVAKSCPTICDPMDSHQSPLPMGFLNNEVSCHFLLQGIFLSQGSNPCLLPALAGAFFTTEPLGKLYRHTHACMCTHTHAHARTCTHIHTHTPLNHFAEWNTRSKYTRKSEKWTTALAFLHWNVIVRNMCWRLLH